MVKRLIAPVTFLLVFALLLAACAQPTVAPEVIRETVVVPGTPEVVTVVETVIPQPVDYGSVVIMSTQGVPVEEAEKMRGIVLADFPGQPEFVGVEEGTMLDRVQAELGEETGSVDVLIALHGTYPVLKDADALVDLSDLAAELSELGIPEAFMELGRLGTDTQYYIPMMQATYIFAANNAAMDYLPSGADPDALTWEDVRDWGRNIEDATGDKKLGFPVDGLMHRFLEGYFYPSFTGGMVSGFRSDDAVAGWNFFKDMWQYVNPQSATYSFMQEQLLSEEVWVAFDHTARLIEAFRERPEDFVALPAPSGPQGRGFMPVIVGIGIPKNAPNSDGAMQMIRYMLQNETQINILREVGFFPATGVDFPGFVSMGVRMEGEAVSKQAGSPDALPALLPVGLGARGGEINQIYRDAFTRIILNGEDIATVLAEEGDNLQTLLEETGAPCWPPDPPSDGACPVP